MDNDQLIERILATADRFIYDRNPEYETCNGYNGNDCLGKGMVDAYKAIGIDIAPNLDILSFSVTEGDVVEVREKSKQIAVLLEATQLPERDVPEYIEADHSKMLAKFIRTPNLGDVPYPVIMEPNLVIEYYAQN